MRLIIVFLAAVLLSSSGYCQSLKPLEKEEAIELAGAWAASAHPPVDVHGLKAEAVFVTKENQWIVRFSGPSGAEVHMLRVEATSGNHPQFVQGDQIGRYEPYFANAGGRTGQP